MSARAFTLQVAQAPSRAAAQAPAHALRGALRRSFEALIRGAHGPGIPTRACTGGDGVDPLEPQAAPEGPCALDGGRPCAACRLFGARHSLQAPALVLGPATAGPDGLQAPGQLNDPSGRLTGWLEAATALTAAVPGLPGPVRLSLHWRRGASAQAPTVTGTRWRITATLQAPAFLGDPETPAASRAYVPGATLRGAVGSWLGAQGAEVDPVIDADQGAAFGPLSPCDDPAEPFPGPWPLTAQVCRDDPAHPPIDVTFDRLAVRWAGSPGEEAAVEARLRKRARCATCGAPMVPRAGFRGAAPVQTVIDGRGQEQLAPGLTLVGEVHRVPPGAAPALARTLRAPLSFGRGQGRAAGRVATSLSPAPTPPPLAERAAAFREALADSLRRAGMLAQVERAPRTVALTLQTDLLPSVDEGPWRADDPDAWTERYDGSQDLIAALLARDVVLSDRPLAVRRFTAAGGFSRRAGGARAPQRAVCAGGVFVFEVQADDATLFAALRALEAQGVGQRRHQGHGRVIAFDPALAAPPPGLAAQEDAMSAPPPDPAGPALVAAAEQLVAQAAAGQLGPAPLARAPLARLAATLRAAGSHAEARNHLRAQTGRAGSGWSPALVTAVVQAVEDSEGFAALDEPARLGRWRALVRFMGNALAWQEVSA